MLNFDKAREPHLHEIGAAEPIKEENLLEFTLLYSGLLLASGNSNPRAKEKHEIRRVFHPQMKRLWMINPNLRRLALNTGRSVRPLIGNDEDQLVEDALRAIASNWHMNGYAMVPLVTDKFTLRVAIDVHLLRPTEKKFIMEQGDIDGQLKSIFDALRLPRSFEEAGKTHAGPDEDPFFCLLEDDRLISEVRVVSDQLLLLPGTKAVTANDAFVSIQVRLNHRYGGTFDRYF